MLKRLARHRLFVILVILLVAICVFAAPLRHDYFSTLVQPPSSCTTNCNVAINAQVTEVRYGAPFGWLLLGKQTDTNGKTIRTYTTKNGKNLIYDAIAFAVCLAIILPMTRTVNRSLSL